MTPYTFLLYGRSGSGKGTQAQLLIDYLKKKDSKRQIEYIETGEKLREFAREVGHTAHMTGRIMSEGGLLPAFIPIWIWTNYFVRYFDGDEHLILDGLARRPYESPILDDAIRFYERKNPYVVHINVSGQWATDKLLSRGRPDDNKIDITSRMEWYDSNVVPAMDYFKKNSYYQFVEVNGEQDVQDVHQEILKKVGI